MWFCFLRKILVLVCFLLVSMLFEGKKMDVNGEEIIIPNKNLTNKSSPAIILSATTQDLFSFIEESFKNMSRSYTLNETKIRKEVVLIIDMNGAYKNSLVNYLSSVDMAWYQSVNGQWEVNTVSVNGKVSGQFGKTPASKTSKVTFPAVYSSPLFNFSFIDNPSMNYTSKLESKIANGFYFQELTQNVTSLKFLFVFAHSDLLAGTNRLSQTIEAFREWFGIVSSLENPAIRTALANSIGIIIASPSSTLVNKTLNDAKKTLQTTFNSLLDKEIDRKSIEDIDFSVELVLKQVIGDLNKLEMFPANTDVRKKGQKLDKTYRAQVVQMISKKLVSLKRSQAELGFSIDDEYLNAYVPEAFAAFASYLKSLLLRNIVFEIGLDNFDTVLNLLNDKYTNVNLSRIDELITNLNQINADILSEIELKVFNVKLRLMRYLVMLMTEQSSDFFMYEENLMSADLISQLKLNFKQYALNSFKEFLSLKKQIFELTLDEYVTNMTLLANNTNGIERVKEFVRNLRNDTTNSKKEAFLITNSRRSRVKFRFNSLNRTLTTCQRSKFLSINEKKEISPLNWTDSGYQRRLETIYTEILDELTKLVDHKDESILNGVYKYTANFVNLSTIFASINNNRNLFDLKMVEIFAIKALVMDKFDYTLNPDRYKQDVPNFYIISPQVTVVDSSVKLDLSCVKMPSKLSKPSSSFLTYGENGKDGEPGLPGYTGGSVFIQTEYITGIPMFFASGGRGGDGQDGNKYF